MLNHACCWPKNFWRCSPIIKDWKNIFLGFFPSLFGYDMNFFQWRKYVFVQKKRAVQISKNLLPGKEGVARPQTLPETCQKWWDMTLSVGFGWDLAPGHTRPPLVAYPAYIPHIPPIRPENDSLKPFFQDLWGLMRSNFAQSCYQVPASSKKKRTLQQLLSSGFVGITVANSSVQRDYSYQVK